MDIYRLAACPNEGCRCVSFAAAAYVVTHERCEVQAFFADILWFRLRRAGLRRIVAVSAAGKHAAHPVLW